jgi:Tfp pilus assembly protein PilV
MKKYNKGQSLFEVVLALALSTLIIVALVSLVSNSIRNSSYSRNKTYATRYTQEATEWLRGQRDGDWDVFSTNFLFCPTPPHVQCLDTLAWGNCGTCSDTEFIGNIFKREVSFADIEADSVTVEVKTYWSDSQGIHEVRNSTILTDWRTLF